MPNGPGKVRVAFYVSRLGVAPGLKKAAVRRSAKMRLIPGQGACAKADVKFLQKIFSTFARQNVCRSGWNL